MTAPLKLRWVLAHVPYDLFLRSANAFSQAVKEKTNGAIEIEVLGKNEWEEKYNNGKEVSNGTFVRLVDLGVIAMSQTYATALGRYSKEFYALDMPFLFRDHEHAARVLDGQIGEYLKDHLAEQSGIKALAFTYSGGYKMMAVNKLAQSIHDLKGTVMRCGRSPVSQATFEAIGAVPVPMGVDGFTKSVSEGECEGGENVFPRYFRSGVNEVTSSVANTEHALFLTSIVISKAIWNKLTAEQQQVLKECAQIAATQEREESLVDGAAAIERCKSEGIEVVEWTADAIGEFKQATAPVYEEFADFFDNKELIEQIKKA